METFKGSTLNSRAAAVEPLNVGRRVSRLDIIAEARTWIGTPWRHQGRLKGVACDCCGVVIKVPAALGIFPADFDVTGYGRLPDPAVMKQWLDALLDPVPVGGELAGDVLWLAPKSVMRAGALPHHLAILTADDSIIHAIDMHRGVSEHRFDLLYRSLLAGVYRYRGLAD